MLLVGLVADGGKALAARIRVANDAQAAARAGAQALDVAKLRQGGAVTLDAGAASSAAQAFLAAAGDTGTVTVSGRQVHVAAQTTSPTSILSLAGVGAITVTATATATAQTGVTTEDSTDAANTTASVGSAGSAGGAP